MCQPVAYDSEEYNSDQFSSGDEYFDREEELRGYNRQIDFTLHTIIEESGEDSEYEPKSAVERRANPHHANKLKRNSDPSEMEKYFLYDVGGVSRDNNASDEFYTDSAAESPLEEEEEDDDYYDEDFDEQDSAQQVSNSHEVEELPQEVQEPKSLDGQMSDNPNTDDSGSVGSESDGRKTPDHKKKKFVRTKNAPRGEHSDRGESDAHGSEGNTATYSSDEEGSENDTLKRKKNKGRRGSEPLIAKLTASNENSTKAESESPKFSPPITPLPSQIIEVQPAAATSNENVSKSISPSLSEKDGFKSSMSPQVPVRKHKSRDSGFVGSMDDLLRNESVGAGHQVRYTVTIGKPDLSSL
jgi:synaptotagmin-like protein